MSNNIKYTDESGQLLTKCPKNKKYSKALPITIYAGSKSCLECKYYKQSKEKYTLICEE